MNDSILKPHQSSGIKWLLERENPKDAEFHGEPMARGGILADEVGLGKTIQSIYLMMKNKMKTLIVVPKSLVKQWMDETAKFGSGLNMRYIKDFSDFDPNYDTCIVSSSIFNKANAVIGNTPIHSVHWGRLIIDESHSIKNKKSKLHKNISSLSTDIRWCLTATPVMNKMEDFISLLGFIGVSQFVCQGYKDDVVNTFVMRRTKEDVKDTDPSLNLPELRVEVRRIPFASKEEKQLYTDVYNDTHERIRKKANITAIEILEMLLRVRQVCAYPQCYIDGLNKKFKADHEDWSHESTKLNTVIADVLKVSDQKSIIFCQFKKEMSGYQQGLLEHGVRSVRIDGDMSIDERMESIQTFKDTAVSVIIIQIHTGGQGYNLQCACNVFITCPTWNPCTEYQAIGRAHRTGQKHRVIVKKYIISDETDTDTVFIEENILQIHDKKRKIMAMALNDERINQDTSVYQKAPPLTRSDLKKLFRK
jgi:SNF2 family DNA or RNA helicase